MLRRHQLQAVLPLQPCFVEMLHPLLCIFGEEPTERRPEAGSDIGHHRVSDLDSGFTVREEGFSAPPHCDHDALLGQSCFTETFSGEG